MPTGKLLSKLKLVLPKIDEEMIEGIEDEDAKEFLEKVVELPDLLDKVDVRWQGVEKVVELPDLLDKVDVQGEEKAEAPKKAPKKKTDKKLAKVEAEEEEEEEDKPRAKKNGKSVKSKKPTSDKKSASDKGRDKYGFRIDSERGRISQYVLSIKKPFAAGDIAKAIKIKNSHPYNQLKKMVEIGVLKIVKNKDGEKSEKLYQKV
jgi:hypothetical protein